VRVDWAVTCRYVESDGAQGTIVGAGTDLLYVPTLPQPVGIMLAVRLAGAIEEIEAGQAHRLTIRIFDPSGEPVRAEDGSEAAPTLVELKSEEEPKQIVSGWAVSPLIALGVQWIASAEGTYTIDVGLEGGSPVPTPVHVLLLPTANG
jgi:hypothetical protein